MASLLSHRIHCLTRMICLTRIGRMNRYHRPALSPQHLKRLIPDRLVSPGLSPINLSHLTLSVSFHVILIDAERSF
ncbi:MAG: hypothetical protein OXC02_09430 [Rhodobacteraceae bacterium]|nr:hypothetical protein [Paracoccaceae bacterium]